MSSTIPGTCPLALFLGNHQLLRPQGGFLLLELLPQAGHSRSAMNCSF